MRVLLTGGSGQVGTEFRRRATDLDLLAPTRAELDLSRPERLAATLAGLAPDLILSVGAYTAVDRAEQEPDLAYAVNRDAVAELADHARRHRVPMIHLSTDYVFGGIAGRPCAPTDSPRPLGVYGASKLAGEQAAMGAPLHLLIRIGWVFSAHGRNFVSTLLRAATAGQEAFRVVDDQLGGPTWAGHVAQGLLATVRRWQSGQHVATGVCHYGGRPHLSWHRFASRIFATARERNLISRIPRLDAIPAADYPTQARRPADTRLLNSPELLAQGWPDPDWQHGLDAVIDEIAGA